MSILRNIINILDQFPQPNRTEALQYSLMVEAYGIDLAARRAIFRSEHVAWSLNAVRVGMFPTSVLTTVNAPYSKKLDAQTLAYCLTHPAAAKAMPGQMSAFFGEVAPALQKEFACAFHISDEDLALAARMFAEFSGESYPLAA